jgi:hypothetical protein
MSGLPLADVFRFLKRWKSRKNSISLLRVELLEAFEMAQTPAVKLHLS